MCYARWTQPLVLGWMNQCPLVLLYIMLYNQNRYFCLVHHVRMVPSEAPPLSLVQLRQNLRPDEEWQSRGVLDSRLQSSEMDPQALSGLFGTTYSPDPNARKSAELQIRAVRFLSPIGRVRACF